MRTGRTRGRAAGRLIAALGSLVAIIVPSATTATRVQAAVPAPYVEQGYWIVTTDGSVFNYGSALNFGGGSGPGKAVWLTATLTGMGYWIPTFGGVVHVFGDEERAYYDLERLWRDASRVAWAAPDAATSAR